MKSGESSASKPSVMRLDGFDRDALVEAIKGADLTHIQISPGRFQGTLIDAPFQSSGINSGAYTRALQGRGRLSKSSVTFFFKMEGEGISITRGCRMTRNTLVLFRPEAEFDVILAKDIHWVSLSLDHARVVQYGRRFFGLEPEYLETDQRVVRPEAGLLPALRQRISDLLRLAENAPEVLKREKMLRNAERDLTKAFLDTFFKGVSDSPRPDTVAPNRYQALRRARDYITAHIFEDIRIADLCAAAGVSKRTLEYAFRDICGLNIRTYLRVLRLNQARNSLLRAEPRSASVSGIAMDWGLWHLGRFSGAYKAMFGELPSETLNRKKGGLGLPGPESRFDDGGE